MTSVARCIVITAAAVIWVPAISWAEDSPNQGYLVDTTGAVVASPTTGLCWRDSDWTPTRAVAWCDATNQPVAVTPAPVPTVVAVASSDGASPVMPPTLPQKISFSADALFAFDHSELQPTGKARLDELISKLNGTTYETIIATGHADRFGSVEYNQALSVRRAQAVKEYLVSKDIPADRIEAVGKGEAEPKTKAGECLGARSAAVIACLQPDRRVDVEMNGPRTMAATP